MPHRRLEACVVKHFVDGDRSSGKSMLIRPKGNCKTIAGLYINANDQLFKARRVRTIIAFKNGNPVRLSDISTAIEGPENTYQAAWMNTSPTVILNIQRQPGANIIKVVDSIKLRLKQL